MKKSLSRLFDKNFLVDTYAFYIISGFAMIIESFLLLLTVAIAASLRRNAIRKKTIETIYDSHFLWIILTAIIGVIGTICLGEYFKQFPDMQSYAFYVYVVGKIWLVYRLLKGMIYLLKCKPIPNPVMII